MGASEIIGLLGGIALFLFGMAIMGDGLKKVAGSKLELVLYKLTSTPLKGVLLGTGVTAVIQSSSATSVMVVGFVNSGMMKVNQAIGIVMGAILGTSVTGWILCLSNLSGDSGWVTLLSTATLTGLVAVVGIVLRMALTGFGFGLFQTPNNRTMVGAAPPERAGGASGMLATARLLGQTSGAAAVGLVMERTAEPPPYLAR